MTVIDGSRIAPHISLDSRGIAFFDGSGTKVMTIVQNKRAARSTPEQLQAAMPHLTIAQVYAALAYYHDHKAEVDLQIRQSHEHAESILASQAPGPSRTELLERNGTPSVSVPS